MAASYPRTVLEFEHWFRTEESCRDYLVKARWPQGFRCPRCGHGQAWRTARGLLHCGGCRADISVTAGTIFQGSHIPLRLWFRAVWWVVGQKGGVSALGLQRVLGLGSYRTAWACLHKLRRSMIRPGREALTGTVEVDEIVVGGHQRNTRGMMLGHAKSLVAVAAEVRGDKIGRIRLKRIPNTTANSLESFVRQAVSHGAKIMTDGRWGYSGLRSLGYTHVPFVLDGKGKEATKLILPRVHQVSSLLKRWILGIYHGRVARHSLDYYLDEFTFRFNRRSSPDRGMLFYRLIQQAVVAQPAPYRTLRGPLKPD